MTDAAYKATAVALQTRRLVTISRRSGNWQAEPTPAGRFFAENGLYPPGHWVAAKKPAPASLPIQRPAPTVERKVTGLRPVDQLIADVTDAGGVLTVETSDGGYWESLVASATRYKKVPAGKILKVKPGRTWSEAVIRLLDAPAWMAVELAPITVAADLRRLHSVVKNLRDDRDRLRLRRDTRTRAILILDALAKSSEARGYQVTAPIPESGYRHSKGLLRITIGGHAHTIDLVELNDSVPHESTVRELKAKERFPWTRIPSYDHVPSGRLALTVIG